MTGEAARADGAKGLIGFEAWELGRSRQVPTGNLEDENVKELHRGVQGPGGLGGGSRRIRDMLRRPAGITAGRSRVARLMRHMGVAAVHRRHRTSLPGKGAKHRVYPCLLSRGAGKKAGSRKSPAFR